MNHTYRARHARVVLCAHATLLMLVAVSCSEPTPTSQTPTACESTGPLGGNGFVIDGGSLQNVSIGLDSLTGMGSAYSSLDIVQGGSVFIIVQGSPVRVGTDSTGEGYFSIRIPRSGTGDFPISGAVSGATVNISVIADGVDSHLTGISGVVSVSTYMNQAPDTAAVVGRFCGTFTEANGTTYTVTGGRFQAES